MLALLRLTLGKKPDDPYERFFGWKHRENPFGTSPAWVAEADGQVVGYRTFLRWEFEQPGARCPAGRARRGHRDPPGVPGPRDLHSGSPSRPSTELADDGVDLVFNTPNDQSRPGYLKMGWTVVGAAARGRPSAWPRGRRADGADCPLPCGGRPAGRPRSPPARPRSTRWPRRASTASWPACLRPAAWATPRTMAYLRWRYGLADLGYRAFAAGHDPAEGLVIGRVRSAARRPSSRSASC